MAKAWAWLKGKKTYIGGALVVIARGLEVTGQPEAARVVQAIAEGAIALGLADIAADKAIGAR